MMPQRLLYSPTRNRRLNEMLGLVVLTTGALMLLALVTYNPVDPSFNTVGGGVGARPAHNWMGLLGSYGADLALQSFGVAVLFVPLVLVRTGIRWMRSRSAGPVRSKVVGGLLWMIFAPAAIALLPWHVEWRSALPIAGLLGSTLADGLIHVVNLPGAIAVCALMVLLSLYLSTSFLLTNANEWFTSHFAFIRWASDRWQAFRSNHRVEQFDEEEDQFQSRRERTAARARVRAQKEAIARRNSEGEDGASTSVLAGLFGWFGRRKAKLQDLSSDSEAAAVEPEAPNVWKSMPRTVLDTVASEDDEFALGLDDPNATDLPSTPPSMVAGAKLREMPRPGDIPFEGAETVSQVNDDNWLDRPERRTPPPMLNRVKPADVPEPPPARMPVPRAVAKAGPVPVPKPPMPSPTADIRDQNIAFGQRADANLQAVTMLAKSVRGYKLPPSTLLYRSDEHAPVRENELREEARVLVQKCAEFGVDGNVEQINPGPVVTTFEFRPDAGVKYSRVTGLADDLCLAMAAESILIERIAGKSTVGIQVPNRERETIWLRDVVESESFAKSKSKLAVAMGKDINGRIVTADLAAMPHVLIAGSTGSGKSVAINAMIMSVLLKSTPEQVRMILVDPKRVELGMYEGIPHLFTPIITEAKLAANALRNAVREMERRLKLLAANHVRNIDQFNKLFENGSEYLFEDVNQEPLPYIMIIIDELADLMMLDRANVEEAITRLAQMARAVGIHLVLATQRPSVDVITGLIKANVPTRMSFRLATKVDSRTIIDSNGAESLLGRGDMLYLPPGTSRLQRVHAPFVTEKEIAAVTKFWKDQGEAEYVEGFLEGPKDEGKGEDGGANDGDDNDPLYDDAVRLVYEFGKASTSLIQRRLRVGYGRAAHLIDMMERDGMVGPADGSKPREILKAKSFYSEVDGAMR
ncbi:DNA segregation ATPase FtsK/SpoIIIE, S-DNA-T family [Bryocella elongata]|uniref:DNA segregation ATPase FtsK/SpoIIIE, S-DNA-T family n=1 Tax=Bryocella elongata TaxID=863522 RepID=A0A1H5WA11_9BACT|nr:DNA translocase FtsK [Bryocella elongata]SEF96031.1 DNA segregation ATPase FtsK/SpoIIIE, S-DNA-T family [Bryocella elongata]